jgi:hypothetical protein
MRRRYYIAAAVLISVGVAGFLFPSPLGGIFEVTPLLNGVHVAAGIAAALAASRGLGTMRWWGQLLGYAFTALAVAGFATDASAAANLLPLSDSNAWFHLTMALVFLYHALLAPPTL